jgi:hypothetical protein
MQRVCHTSRLAKAEWFVFPLPESDPRPWRVPDGLIGLRSKRAGFPRPIFNQHQDQVRPRSTTPQSRQRQSRPGHGRRRRPSLAQILAASRHSSQPNHIRGPESRLIPSTHPQHDSRRLGLESRFQLEHHCQECVQLRVFRRPPSRGRKVWLHTALHRRSSAVCRRASPYC